MKRGQTWGFDLVIAVILFTIGVIGIYLYAINFSGGSSELGYLFQQADSSSSLILSEGTPPNWTTSKVNVPGIITNNRINQTKLLYFSNLINTTERYEQSKKLLNLDYDYYFNFSDFEGLGRAPENQTDLIKIERVTIYKNKPVKFSVYIWENE